MKNVLFVLQSLRRAGAQMQTVAMANGIDNAMFRKHLYTFEPLMDLRSAIHPEVRFENRNRRRKVDFGLISNLANYIEEHRIDIVYCTLQYALFVAWMTRLFTRRRPLFVAAIHTTLNRDLKSEFKDRILYEKLLKRCARVVFVCRKQKEYWTEKFPALKSNARVIYNGVDLAHFHPSRDNGEGAAMRAALNIPEDGFVLSCIAGLRPEKGHSHLIRALALAADDVFLLIAGDGPLKEQLQVDVLAGGLKGRVFFLGPVLDVRPVLMASDLSILASTAVETFSMAMLESMAMSRPVIATDLGGMSEAVEHGTTGILIPPGDAEAMAKAIHELTQDRDRVVEMGHRARMVVEERFSEQAMIRENESMLLSLNSLKPNGHDRADK
jgi:glycosyltransferase involved in cell wall biosynthesis